MKIAVDARELAPRPTGVGRYLLEILRVWAVDPAAADCTVTVCAPTSIHLHLGEGGARLATVVIPGSPGQLWEQLRLPLAVRGEADVLFAPAYSAPVFAPAPTVLTIHDVSFFAHPEWFSWREGIRRRFVTRKAAARASRVLTLTEFSRGELVRHVGLPTSRLEVISLGPSGLAVQTPAQAREPMILYVGSILARRHVADLVAGFGRLAQRHRNLRLVIAGDARGVRRDELEKQIRDAGVSDRVTVTGFVTDAELADLYRRASAFAFLSSYEGFGLTPLDAIAAGVPPVVLDTPTAREVYGDAAHYVPHPDPALIEAALDRVLFDTSARSALLAAGPVVVGRYSWTSTGRATLAAITEAAR